MLIDVAISGDRNVIKKEAEKVLKYKDLTIELQRMWNVKTKAFKCIQNRIESLFYSLSSGKMFLEDNYVASVLRYLYV
jgi:hypothetical protein